MRARKRKPRRGCASTRLPCRADPYSPFGTFTWLRGLANHHLNNPLVRRAMLRRGSNLSTRIPTNGHDRVMAALTRIARSCGVERRADVALTAPPRACSAQAHNIRCARMGHKGLPNLNLWHHAGTKQARAKPDRPRSRTSHSGGTSLCDVSHFLPAPTSLPCSPADERGVPKWPLPR